MLLAQPSLAQSSTPWTMPASCTPLPSPTSTSRSQPSHTFTRRSPLRSMCMRRSPLRSMSMMLPATPLPRLSPTYMMPLVRCTLLLSHTSTSSPSQPQLLWLPLPQLLPMLPPQPSLTPDTPLPQLSLDTQLPQLLPPPPLSQLPQLWLLPLLLPGVDMLRPLPLGEVMPLPPQPTPAGPLAPQPLLPGRSTKSKTPIPVPSYNVR